VEAELGNRVVWQVKLRWASTALGVVIALGVGTVLEYFNIEEDFRVVRFEAMRMGLTPAEYERPKVHLLTQMDALLKAARIVPGPNMDATELDLLRKVALRHPGPATQYRYALSLALNGNPDEAIRQLQVIRILQGEKTYTPIKEKWEALVQEKYPQLKNLKLP
jgi:hypothetical protein